MEKNIEKINNKEIQNRSNKGYGIFDPFFDSFFRFPNLKNEIKEMEKLMKTDVIEKENNYEIEIELPGYDKQDINLELANGYLTITANKSEQIENKTKNNIYIRQERIFGNCARSFYVGDIREEDITASLEKGILNINIHKQSNKEMKRKIEIK